MSSQLNRLDAVAFKRSFTTRNVDLCDALVSAETAPQEGDLVLVKVTRLRQQARLETPEGRRAHLFAGDYLLGVCGKRYSSKYYRASAMPQRQAHLLTTSGIVGWSEERSTKVKPPTELEVVGCVVDRGGKPLNLRDYRVLPRAATVSAQIPVLLVVGSDMDAGKTTLAISAIRGLSLDSRRVFGFKLTGSGSGPDYWRMQDAGAEQVSDFLEAGFVSTFELDLDRLLEIFNDAQSAAISCGSDLLVVEVADGVLQAETAALLESEAFRKRISGVLLAADSAVSALHLSTSLTRLDYRIIGVGGVFTQYPLAIDEFAVRSGYPVFDIERLQEASGGAMIYAMLTAASQGYAQQTQ